MNDCKSCYQLFPGHTKACREKSEKFSSVKFFAAFGKLGYLSLRDAGVPAPIAIIGFPLAICGFIYLCLHDAVTRKDRS